MTKRARPKRTQSLRPDLIIVKANEGNPSYADMLRQLKNKPSLKKVGENITKVRRNTAGNL